MFQRTSERDERRIEHYTRNENIGPGWILTVARVAAFHVCCGMCVLVCDLHLVQTTMSWCPEKGAGNVGQEGEQPEHVLSKHEQGVWA